jgi:hypothetical protein
MLENLPFCALNANTVTGKRFPYLPSCGVLHRARLAALAISFLLSGEIDFARALPPARPPLREATCR